MGTASSRPPRLLDVERGEHREDHLAVLQRGDVARRERPAVAVPVDLEDHRPLGPPGTEEVAVQRVRVAVVGHGQAGRTQGLRCHLAAEQGSPLGGVDPMDGTEEVPVDLLDVEHRREVLGDREAAVRGGGHGRNLPWTP